MSNKSSFDHIVFRNSIENFHNDLKAFASLIPSIVTSLSADELLIVMFDLVAVKEYIEALESESRIKSRLGLS
jgi:hypothetical protein